MPITLNMLSEEMAPAAGHIEVIRRESWQPHAAGLKHVFLVGDLQRAVPHPFLRRSDAEIIWCEYNAGDDGRPHWHATVDEIEVVLKGEVGYRDIGSEEVFWFREGDLVNVPRGVCVERFVREPARTLAIKLPSRAEKVHCGECRRACAQRREAFRIE